jgi:adenylylsulfate kinase
MRGAIRPGFAIWLTGLPSSGKTTLAHALSRLLAERGIAVQILDSDGLRRRLTPNPTYSAEEAARRILRRLDGRGFLAN